MRTFTLSDTDSTLLLQAESSDDKSPYGNWCYKVDLKGHSVSAEIEVVDHLPQEFARYFRQLAESWGGWKGLRIYESLEPGLKIECAHDGLGLCSVQITLGPNLGTWSATQEFQIECGALEQLASNAEAFAE